MVVASAVNNPYQQVGHMARKYRDIRPSYPGAIIDWLLADYIHAHAYAHTTSSQACAHQAHAQVRAHTTAVDIGAGTGILTRQLYERGCAVLAVEPSKDMRREFRAALPDIPESSLYATSAEATGLADSSCDVATYGQCWHWLQEDAAAKEAARIVRPGGVVGVLANQLAVEEPWVLRLSRIMRSGDVARLSRPPNMGADFTSPQVRVHEWSCAMTPEEICELGTTRASWLRARPEGRAWMRANMRWYLYQHLGLQPGQIVQIPYHTYAWKFHRISAH